MNINHLDTLVGPRSPLYQKLYNAMLKAYTLELNYTLVEDEIEIGKYIDMGDSNDCLYSITYKDNHRVYNRCHLYSIVHTQYNHTPRIIRIANIDNICRYMMNDDDQSQLEPWEVN